MLNIGIDLERLRNVNSGLGQFCKHLGDQLLKQKPEGTRLHYYYPAAYEAPFKTHAHYVGIADKLFGIRNRELQLFHCTHQDSHLFPKSIPTILTIHDLNFIEKYPEPSKRGRKLQRLQKKINKAKGLVFISRYTEQLVKQHLQVPAIPTQVIYNGNCLDTTVDAVKPGFIKAGEFIFSIGIISPKKNFHTLLPLVKHNGLQLVIAGNNTHTYAANILEKAAEMGIADRVILPGQVSDQEKLWLYRHCKAFVFPSLAEGFGLPVTEAMSQGKPVFLSDKTSLPEVGGPLAYYWNSFEPAHMNAVFEKGLQDFAGQNDQQNASVAWASQFSWEQTARAYLDFYSEVYTTIK